MYKIWGILNVQNYVLMNSFRRFSGRHINIYTKFKWFCACDQSMWTYLENDIIIVYIHSVLSLSVNILFKWFSVFTQIVPVVFIFFLTPKPFPWICKIWLIGTLTLPMAIYWFSFCIFYHRSGRKKKLHGSCP